MLGGTTHDTRVIHKFGGIDAKDGDVILFDLTTSMAILSSE